MSQADVEPTQDWMVIILHSLQIIREMHGLSAEDLEVLSGVDVGTIKRIESGRNPFKTNYTVAEALESALDVQPEAIFSKAEISHLGRHANTGKPIGNTRKHFTICMNCNCEVHISHEICVHCEKPVNCV